MAFDPQIQIDFEAMLAKARADWQAFRKEVESTPIRINFDTSGLSGTGGGRRARSVASGPTTFGGASGVPTGGTFTPPPSVADTGPIYYNIGGARIAGPAMPPVDPDEVAAATGALTSPMMGLKQRDAQNLINRATQHGARTANDIISSSLEIHSGGDPKQFGPKMPSLDVDTSLTTRAAERVAAALNRKADEIERVPIGRILPEYRPSGRGSTSARDPETGQFTTASSAASNYPLAPYTQITRYGQIVPYRGGGWNFSGPGSGPQGFTGWQWGQRALPGPGHQYNGDEVIDAEWTPSGPQAANTSWSNSGPAQITGAGAGGTGPTALAVAGGGGGGAAMAFGGYGGARPYNQGGSSSGSGGAARRLRHPMFAAMFAFFQTQQAVNEMMQRYASVKQDSRSGMFDPLETQVQLQYQKAVNQESNWSTFLWTKIGESVTQASMGQINGTKWLSNMGIAQQGDADMMAQALQTIQGQKAGDSALRSSRSLNRASSLIGMTGFSQEFGSAQVEYDNALDDLVPIERAAGFAGSMGFMAQRASLWMVKQKRQNEILVRVGQSRDQLIGSRYVSQLMGANRIFDSEVAQLDLEQIQASQDFQRSIGGLPPAIQTTMTTAFNAMQQSQKQAMIAQQQLGVNMANARNEYSANALHQTRVQGQYSIEGARAAVNAEFLPEFDKSGNVTGFMGMDKSKMTQQEFASKLNLYNESMTQSVHAAEQGLADLQGRKMIIDLQLGRRNFGAQHEALRRKFRSETGADTNSPMDHSSPQWQALFKNYQGEVDLLNQQEADFKNTANIGLQGQARALKAGLAHDTMGAQFENLMTGFDQQADQFKGPELREQRRQVFQNQLASAKLFQQNYLEAFRGESLDLRRFAVNNPRDVQDPGQVLGRIEDKMDQIKDAIANVGD